MSLDITNASLKIELEDGTQLYIKDIVYTIEKEIDGELPRLFRDIDDIVIEYQDQYTLDLSNYYASIEDIRFQAVSTTEGIDTEEFFGYLIFTPPLEYSGTSVWNIIAENDAGSVESNEFRLTVLPEGVKLNQTIDETINETVNMTPAINETINITINETFNITINATLNITINETVNISMNETLNTSINESFIIANNTQVLGNVTIGMPVRWKIEVEKERNETKKVYIPKESFNITIVEEDTQDDIVENISVKDVVVETAAEGMQVVEEVEITDEVIKPKENENKPGGGGLAGITGAIIGDIIGGEDSEEEETKEEEQEGEEEQEDEDDELDEDEEEFKEIEISAPVENVEIEYVTPGPNVTEENITKHKKRIVVSSSTHYINIIAYTYIDDIPRNSINLYWLVNGSRRKVEDVKYFDDNNNSLIDRIQWIVPSLSNQTYEVEILVLNVQSYPTVGGNWTVRFNTTGTADLRITAINGTTFGGLSDNESYDLEFLKLVCGETPVEYDIISVDNNTIMPYEAYILKKRIKELEERLAELG